MMKIQLKAFFILALLLSSPLTQAQIQAPTAAQSLQEGKVVTIVWQRELIEAGQASELVFLIAYKHNSEANKNFLQMFVPLATEAKGQFLFAQASIEDTSKAGSGIAHLCDKTKNENEINIFLIAKGQILANLELAGNESAEIVVQAMDKMVTVVKAQLTGQGQPAAQAASGAETSAEPSPITELKTEADLDTLIENSKDVPVIVEFSAPSRCPPCRALAPRLKEAAARFKGKVRFISVQVDEHSDVARKYMKTNGIPELQVFKKGKKSGKLIETSFDVEELVQTISKATGVQP